MLRVKKLSDHNVYSWKQNKSLVLSSHNLYSHLDDDEGATTKDDSSSAWVEKDLQAMAVIGLSLSNEDLAHVQDLTTENKMWQSVLDIYEKHTLLNKLTARRKCLHCAHGRRRIDLGVYQSCAYQGHDVEKHGRSHRRE